MSFACWYCFNSNGAQSHIFKTWPFVSSVLPLSSSSNQFHLKTLSTKKPHNFASGLDAAFYRPEDSVPSEEELQKPRSLWWNDASASLHGKGCGFSCYCSRSSYMRASSACPNSLAPEKMSLCCVRSRLWCQIQISWNTWSKCGFALFTCKLYMTWKMA